MMTTVPAPTSIPQLRGLPFLGAALTLQHDRLAFLRRASRVGGEIVHFRLGPREGYFVNSSDLVQEVLVAHAPEVEKAFRFLRRSPLYLLGNGLLTSMNAFHRRQRKLIAPAFQPRRIVAYADCMTSYAEQIQALWANGATIDVAHEMMRLTLWIVGKTLFDALRFAGPFIRHGGVVLGVNTWGEYPDLIAAYARTRRVTWPLLPNPPGDVGSLYGIRGTPTNVFVDRRGVIRAIAVGPQTVAQFQAYARGL
jgi:hypothetical protein